MDLTEGTSNVKGRVFEEAAEEGRFERAGLGGARMWTNGRGLWSWRSAATLARRSPRHSGSARGQNSCHSENCRCDAARLSGNPVRGTCACFLGKSEDKKNEERGGQKDSKSRIQKVQRRVFQLTCLAGGGRVSLGALWAWVGGGVSI